MIAVRQTSVNNLSGALPLLLVFIGLGVAGIYYVLLFQTAHKPTLMTFSMEQGRQAVTTWSILNEQGGLKEGYSCSAYPQSPATLFQSFERRLPHSIDNQKGREALWSSKRAVMFQSQGGETTLFFLRKRDHWKVEASLFNGKICYAKSALPSLATFF